MKPSIFILPRSEISLNLKIIAVLLATLAIYHQDLTIIGNEAVRSELMGHILIIPFLFSYMLYRKRKMLKTVIPFETSDLRGKIFFTHELFGVTLCLLAFLSYWHGSYTFHPLEYHMASLPLFVAGCTLIIFNTQTLKVLALPIAFLLFLIPPPLEIIYTAGTNLSTFNSQAAFTILKAIGLPVSQATNYGTPAILLENSEGLPLTITIDIACAGIYSLTGFTIFAAFAAYVTRGVTWKKAAMFLAGFPLIYCLNITRIIIIVLIGYYHGMEIAMQAFHLFGGWILTFLGTLLLLFLSEKILNIQIFREKSKTSCPKCSQSAEKEENFCIACGRLLKNFDSKISKRDLCKIVALLISASLIALPAVPVFALTEGPAEVIIQSAGNEQESTQILPEIPEYTLQFIQRDMRFEEIAKQDASLIYAYLPTEGSKTKIWVTIEIAGTGSSLHRTETCLITFPQTLGHQPRVTQLDLREVHLLQNPLVIGRYFACQETKSKKIQVYLYWYENAIFNTDSGLQKKYAKISLIAFTHNPEALSKIEEQLLPLGEEIVNYWKPIKSWSWIALEIARNGSSFITVTIAFLGIMKGGQVIRNQKEKKSNLKAYNKLASREKLILQAAYQAAKEEKPTINAIATAYHKLANEPIQPILLLEKLSEAEEASLVKSEIISQNDEPVLIWKSQAPL